MAKPLTTIEARITELLQQDRYRWQELAQLALEVRQHQLYLEKDLPSFTAWIRAIAQAAGRQPSLFWRYLKAASYYLRQVNSDDLDRINEIEAAPEALDRLEKIERQAPRPIFEAMRDKVLAGEATVAECRDVELQYRPQQPLNNRGRPRLGSEGSYSHFGQWRSAPTALSPQQQEDLSRDRSLAAIQSSLQTYAALWTRDALSKSYPPRHHHSHSQVTLRAPGQAHCLEQIVVTRWDIKQPKQVFGIAPKSCLADFEGQTDWEHYLPYCHYFCFAIPLQDKALQHEITDSVPHHVGLLGIDLQAEPDRAIAFPIQVLRPPLRTQGDNIGELYAALYDDLLAWNSKTSTQEFS